MSNSVVFNQQSFDELMDDARAAHAYLQSQCSTTAAAASAAPPPPPPPLTADEEIERLISQAQNRNTTPQQRYELATKIAKLRGNDPQSFKAFFQDESRVRWECRPNRLPSRR